MGYGMIFDVLNKLMPGRKAKAVNTLQNLIAEYQKALHDRRDTDAAILKKQMQDLREKWHITEGNL